MARAKPKARRQKGKRLKAEQQPFVATLAVSSSDLKAAKEEWAKRLIHRMAGPG